ncbi:MAG: hypothetical protein NVS3B7_18390 [Candidatus Elarobacter sp.]
MAGNFFEKAGGFAQDAAVDTAADGAINNVIDGVASHIPGGGAFDTMLKTGVDLAANNAINAELGKVEGMFGHHDAAPAAQQGDASDAPADDRT